MCVSAVSVCARAGRCVVRTQLSGSPLSCKYNTARAVLSRNYALLLRSLFRVYYYSFVIFVSDAVANAIVLKAPMRDV